MNRPPPVTRSARPEVRELAERLTLEYAGAVPAGQVLSLVLRAAQAVTVGGKRLEGPAHVELTEQVARAWLTRQITRG